MSSYAQEKIDSAVENKKTPTPVEKPVTAKVYRDRNKPGIQGLSILSTELQLFFVPKSEGLKSYVDVSILFQRPGWSLQFMDKVLFTPSEQSTPIGVPIYLNETMNSLPLKAVGPQGEIENEIIYIESPKVSEKVKNQKEWDELLISLGSTYLDYYQTGSGNYKSLSSAVKVEYASAPQTWSGLGYYSAAALTALPFWESPLKSGSQFLEGQVDASYFTEPHQKLPLTQQFLFGINYSSLFANSSPFGFSNLISPDLGYRLHYFLKEDSAAIFDFHYMALGLPTQFKTYGFDLSFAYSFKFSNHHRGQIELDYLLFQYEPIAATQVKTNTLKLIFGYGL